MIRVRTLYGRSSSMSVRFARFLATAGAAGTATFLTAPVALAESVSDDPGPSVTKCTQSLVLLSWMPISRPVAIALQVEMDL